MIVLLSDDPSRRGVGALVARTARPHLGVLLTGLVASTVAGLLVVAVPVLLGQVVDALLADDGQAAVRAALLALGCAVVQVGAAAVGRERLVRAGERVVRDLRDRVLDQLTTAPLRFLERHRTGDLMQRATAQVASLSGFVRDVLPELVLTGGTVLVTVVVLATQSWAMLAVLVVVFTPAAAAMLHRFRRGAPAAFAAEAQAEARVSAEMAEVVRVRPLLAGAPLRARRLVTDPVDEAGGTAVRAQLRTVVLTRWIHGMDLVEALTLAALVLSGTALVARGSVSVGVVVTFVLAGRTLFTGFADLSSLVADVEAARTDVARTADLLRATAPTNASAPVPVAAGPELVLDRVTFGYDGDPVLRDVTLGVSPGHRVVLVGRTGAGKSTLVKLLTGLYAPDSGTVTCGGVDLHPLAPEDRVRLVALVPQSVHLAAGTVADDLRLVRPGATDAELARAVDALDLGPWLARLPTGLATATSALSAGERQLVGLLRVALLDSAVLVLDEVTSDVDPDTAHLVETAVDRLAADRAVVVVAHRADTVARWGEVLVVEDGGVRPLSPEPARPR
ncbi:ABC transporter ATP-binding protein [Cellulomonas sp. Leaf334]|uniref:ATP-binding cassette domain-containing protein n=1 Tax=Cellulomonas sp. Leaf334 TaxID=1736339 RepID=UPI0006FE789F|nr:ABC transporter ATP-binding protein [Cellulomonas sp. Leaf334]KQR16485.1 hypothetical protein ASF78_03660 [Cellulomonas sp. Leaf334]